MMCAQCKFRLTFLHLTASPAANERYVKYISLMTLLPLLLPSALSLIASSQLKCTEERPACAQCLKATRECIPSSGITFRHQQNPSMNGATAARESLKSFYGYKETFGRDSVWVDIPQELTFVHTSNPYEDEDGRLDDTTFGLNATSGSLQTRLEHEESFAENMAETEYPVSDSAYPTYATHGLEALSAVASQDQYNYAPPPAQMTQHELSQQQQQQQEDLASPQRSHATPSQKLKFILNPSAHISPPSNIDPSLHSEPPTQIGGAPVQSPTHVRTSSYNSVRGPSLPGPGSIFHAARRRQLDGGRATITNPELAFLLRDFSERAGFWMDLFDLGLFFATKVPVLAITCPLLLNSCAALSAKSLARVDGRKPILGGQATARRQSKLEHWPGEPPDTEGWVRKAREYYDLAVSLLRQALAGATRTPASSLPLHARPETVSNAQELPLPSTDSDELVAATAILGVYEFLDASGPEWSRHLDGAKSLFDIAKDRMVPLTRPLEPVSLAQQVSTRLAAHPLHDISRPEKVLSQGRIAVFWNFTRQDMLSAFINSTNTRLDTADLQMWRNAGLKLTPDGFVCPSNPEHRDYIKGNEMTDDLISNALIWIIMKVINFMFADDAVLEAMSPLGLGVRQRELLGYWEGLHDQLNVWYEGLPSSFYPTAVRRPGVGELEIEQKWFPRPMCASTMQSYHCAMVYLLHNKPHLSTASPLRIRHRNLEQPGLGAGAGPGSSLAARHASYPSILQQSRAHAKEVVAVGLGRSDEGTRIHSVQPLWTAGLVLGASEDGAEVTAETNMWRRSVISQLRGIERDMGWATEYRVQSLLELWRLPSDWGVNEL